MLDEVKKLLAGDEQPEGGEAGKPELQVAVCALLLEMAHVDFDYDPSERETIIAVLSKRFGLGQAETGELLALAEAGRAAYPELSPFIATINKAYGGQEKFDLLVMLWQVILADKRLDAYEQLLMRKLGPMLSVDESKVEEAMQRARESDPLTEPPGS